ncbi:hypothetical protein KCU74_g118, partial [Aureobasidium melanogenum]
MHSEQSRLLPQDPPIPSYEAAVGARTSESRDRSFHWVEGVFMDCVFSPPNRQGWQGKQGFHGLGRIKGNLGWPHPTDDNDNEL